MRNLIRLSSTSVHAAVLALLIFGVDTVALGAADGPDFYCVKDVPKGDSLNLRAKPSAKAKVVTTIPRDACHIENLVVCVGQNGEAIPESDAPPKGTPRPYWCKVKYNGEAGWVAGQVRGRDAPEHHGDLRQLRFLGARG